MVDRKLVHDPTGPVRAILILYADHKIAPAGADVQIMLSLFL